jgi:hypothetical protein
MFGQQNGYPPPGGRRAKGPKNFASSRVITASYTFELFKPTKARSWKGDTVVKLEELRLLRWCLGYAPRAASTVEAP